MRVCTTTTPPKPNASPDWGIWGTGGATGGASASPNTPGFLAENGGGWFDFWGSPGIYNCMAQDEGPGYERVTYGTNIANRITLENFYMTVGGTSWGWLPAPVVYTSYDYGAAISEARELRPAGGCRAMKRSSDCSCRASPRPSPRSTRAPL